MKARKQMSLREFTEMVRDRYVALGADFAHPDDDWPIMIGVYHPGDPDPVHTWTLPGWVSNNERMKHMYAEAMGMAAPTTKPTMIATAISAWVRELSREEGEHRLLHGGPPISSYEDKTEELMVIAADPEVEYALAAKINRTPDAPPTLSEWAPKFDGGRLVGAMIDPWRRALR